MSKTPYEIRLETLQLAFSILAEQKRMISNDHYHLAPTTQEILDEAMLLRNFIDNEKLAAVVENDGSPERRTFFIDLGDTPPEQIEAALERIMTKTKITSEDARVAVEGGPVTEPEPIQAEFPDKQDRAAFLQSIKDAGECCGGTGGDACECNLPESGAGC